MAVYMVLVLCLSVCGYVAENVTERNQPESNVIERPTTQNGDIPINEATTKIIEEITSTTTKITSIDTTTEILTSTDVTTQAVAATESTTPNLTTESTTAVTSSNDLTSTESSTKATSSAPQNLTTTVRPMTPGPNNITDYVDKFPEPPICGSSNASFSRVIGGVNAKVGDFPWMILIGYVAEVPNSVYFKCGGALITNKHVLTAAHCVYGAENTIYIVRLGEVDISRKDEGPNQTVDMLIKYAIVHEQFNPGTLANDIAVIVMAGRVAFTDYIKPICMPLDPDIRNMTFDNYNPYLAGWGKTSNPGPLATHLQVIQLPVVPVDACAEKYVPLGLNVDKRSICAGTKQGQGGCHGDSGGPLMQPIWNPVNLTTYYYEIGIVSYGKPCAHAGYPGVHSRVTYYIPWIQEKVLGTHADSL